MSEQERGRTTRQNKQTNKNNKNNELSEEGETLATTTWDREEAKRRRRRDSGSFQVSERDLELLALIAEQYAVTLDQLARLIGRTYRTARGLHDRWCKAGWTQSARLAVELPPFVWLSSSGSRLIDSPYRTWNAHPSLATHIEAVTDVRLLLERELQIGEWECERSLAQGSPSRSENRPHLPDASSSARRGSRSRLSSTSRAAPASKRSSSSSAASTTRFGTSPRSGCGPG